MHPRNSQDAPTRDEEKKADIEYAETVPNLPTPDSSSGSSGKDAALEILGADAPPIQVTLEQDQAVLRKIDLWLMPIIVMVYFLQQLDKYVFILEYRSAILIAGQIFAVVCLCI